MKAIISTTSDDKYLFFLPIVTWCWNKLGVGVILFRANNSMSEKKWTILNRYKMRMGLQWDSYPFECPEHKEATYAQCSRLYAAGGNILDMPEDEILITSDVDMAIFKLPPYEPGYFTVFGSDLVPKKQIPMCYVSAIKQLWNQSFSKDQSYQTCLDILLGGIEADHFRGNFWAKDQEELHNGITNGAPIVGICRAKHGTQFASNRVDRDDINWRSYLGPDLVDAHLWRPGYEVENFQNILELLETQYPNESFRWLIEYRNEYIKLL